MGGIAVWCWGQIYSKISSVSREKLVMPAPVVITSNTCGNGWSGFPAFPTGCVRLYTCQYKQQTLQYFPQYIQSKLIQSNVHMKSQTFMRVNGRFYCHKNIKMSFFLHGCLWVVSSFTTWTWKGGFSLLIRAVLSGGVTNSWGGAVQSVGRLGSSPQPFTQLF